jgi:hypothetical protein
MDIKTPELGDAQIRHENATAVPTPEAVVIVVTEKPPAESIQARTIARSGAVMSRVVRIPWAFETGFNLPLPEVAAKAPRRAQALTASGASAKVAPRNGKSSLQEHTRLLIGSTSQKAAPPLATAIPQEDTTCKSRLDADIRGIFRVKKNATTVTGPERKAKITATAMTTIGPASPVSTPCIRNIKEILSLGVKDVPS